MGKQWRPYRVGAFRLQQLNGRPVAVWTDADGARRRVRLDACRTEAEARARLDQFAAEALAGRAAKGVTVGEIFRSYIQDRERDGKQVASMRYNWLALAPMFDTRALTAVDARVCQDYAKSRFISGRSPGTVWTELQRLRSALNWAEKRRIIPLAPDVWVPSKPGPKDRVLSVFELERLLTCCSSHHLLLFVEIAIGTGARSGAILELTWDRVDFESGAIRLTRPEPYNPLQKRARKRRATVGITARLRAALVAAKRGAVTDHVIEWNAAPVASIKTAFKAAVGRAGLVGVTPHTLRHTVVSWAMADGVDLERISRWVGHSDISITRRIYAHTDVGFVEPAARAVELRLIKGSK